MDEKDLFNKDTMFWRELNASLPANLATIIFNQPIAVNNKEVLQVECLLLPYIAHDVEYEMDNGGAFKKNEVKEWRFVGSDDRVHFENVNTSIENRETLIQVVRHEYVQCVILRDDNGNVIVEKSKI